MKLDIHHLRIFGCLVYFHVSNDKKNTLEGTKNKDTLLGYCNSLVYIYIYLSARTHNQGFILFNGHEKAHEYEYVQYSYDLHNMNGSLDPHRG